MSHFSSRAAWHRASFAAIFAAGLYALFFMSIDPFAWFYYLLFSLIVYFAGQRFQGWVWARGKLLDQEMDRITERLTTERVALDRRSQRTEAVNERAHEMEHLFEKVKEMSKSLDVAETFLIFAEALFGHFQFQSIRLTLFNDDGGPQSFVDVYELQDKDFGTLFDRSVYIKDKTRLRAVVTPMDKKIYETVFQVEGVLRVGENHEDPYYKVFSMWPEFKPFLACPVFLNSKIIAILTLTDVRDKDSSVLSVLTERFISEVQRVKLYERIQTLAITDGLTGAYVRRHLLERLAGEIDRSERLGFKLSFLMVDIDYFKSFNDHYGHLVGDVVLKQVADTVKKSVRELDLVGRYGGEEFGVLLVETDESGAFYVAERIRKAVAEKEFAAYGEKLSVTVSVGCATYSSVFKDMNVFIDAADQALYDAKRQGRNRVCISEANL